MGPPPPPVGRWSTRVCQTDHPTTCEDICLGTILCPCGAARAKSWADKSNGLFNLLCLSSCYSYNSVRNQYNIPGVCGDDMCYGLFCFCCTSRRILTEGRLRGNAMYTDNYGAESREWHYSLFDCNCCEMCSVCICPCMVASDIHTMLQPQHDSCCFDCFCTNPASMYGQVRHSYGIVSDCPLCEDICLPLVCCPCALNRARKEALRAPNPSNLPATLDGKF